MIREFWRSAVAGSRSTVPTTRVFLDYLRNAQGQAAVAPYAVRARQGAPVATPLQWDEVWQKSLRPQRYRIDNLFRRLGQTDDPWADISRHTQALPTSERLRAIR